jgi:hypothetical protein
MLNEMRFGKMKTSTIQAFKSLSRKVTYTDGIEPTELYAPFISVIALQLTFMMADIRHDEKWTLQIGPALPNFRGKSEFSLLKIFLGAM